MVWREGNIVSMGWRVVRAVSLRDVMVVLGLLVGGVVVRRGAPGSSS